MGRTIDVLIMPYSSDAIGGFDWDANSRRRSRSRGSSMISAVLLPPDCPLDRSGGVDGGMGCGSARGGGGGAARRLVPGGGSTGPSAPPPAPAIPSFGDCCCRAWWTSDPEVVDPYPPPRPPPLPFFPNSASFPSRSVVSNPPTSPLRFMRPSLDGYLALPPNGCCASPRDG